MDEAVMARLREMYGLEPGVAPLAMQFPRLPPGLLRPAVRMPGAPGQAARPDAGKVMPRLEDYREMYHRHASGLLDFGASALIPPGHPIHSAKNSIESLRGENEKLRKENARLKEQAGTAGMPRHDP